MPRVLIAVLAWVVVICAAPAHALDFPALTGRVVDEANVLDESTKASLTDTLAGLESKTTDQLVVVTLKSLRGTSIEDYGYQLGRTWQIGQKGKDNGVLLIVVPSERGVRIEVGYGLEGTLTDAITRLIIENSILPHFKAGDLPGGVKRGVEDIVQVLTGDAAEWQSRAAKSASSAASDVGTDPSWPFIGLLLGGLGFLIVCALLGGWLCQIILQMLFSALASGSSRSSSGGSSWSGGGGSSWSGGGGSFGGGGASGRW